MYGEEKKREKEIERKNAIDERQHAVYRRYASVKEGGGSE